MKSSPHPLPCEVFFELPTNLYYQYRLVEVFISFRNMAEERAEIASEYSHDESVGWNPVIELRTPWMVVKD